MRICMAFSMSFRDFFLLVLFSRVIPTIIIIIINVTRFVCRPCVSFIENVNELHLLLCIKFISNGSVTSQFHNDHCDDQNEFI